MARLLRAVAAQRIITDTETNSVSYIDLIEAVVVAAFPAMLPAINIGTLWQREQNEPSFTVRLRTVGPDGKEVAPPAVFPPQHFGTNIRYRLNFAVGGIPTRSAGFHNIKVELQDGDEWKQVGEVQIDVSQARKVSSAPAPRSSAAPAVAKR